MIDRNCLILVHGAFILLLQAGCSPTTPTLDTLFDASQISEMQFQIEPSNELSTIAQDEQDLSARVADNLAEWGYLITAVANEKQTHDLIAIVGNINLGPTPVGFSFNAGNSNPRALDFQKAEILPITCMLTAKDNPDQISAELNMDFAGKDFLKYDKESEYRGELVDQLVDDMATVCYNLLSGLKVPTHIDLGTESTTTPTWVPAISIENVPVEETPAPTTTQTKPAAETVPVTQPQPRIQEDPRKRIVIKNQGSPVIFTFGHERK